MFNGAVLVIRIFNLSKVVYSLKQCLGKQALITYIEFTFKYIQVPATMDHRFPF